MSFNARFASGRVVVKHREIGVMTVNRCLRASSDEDIIKAYDDPIAVISYAFFVSMMWR